MTISSKALKKKITKLKQRHAESCSRCKTKRYAARLVAGQRSDNTQCICDIDSITLLAQMLTRVTRHSMSLSRAEHLCLCDAALAMNKLVESDFAHAPDCVELSREIVDHVAASEFYQARRTMLELTGATS